MASTYAEEVLHGNGRARESGGNAQAAEKILRRVSRLSRPGTTNYVVHALSTAIEPVVQLCASGVLERFPKLRFGTVEAGIGWLAWTLWVMDEGYKKHHFWVAPKLPMLPSDYFRRQGFATFQDDPIGLQTRQWVGIENLLWGDDYPHHEGTWPRSQAVIERTMADLTEDERQKVLGLNAAKLYGFEVPT